MCSRKETDVQRRLGGLVVGVQHVFDRLSTLPVVSNSMPRGTLYFCVHAECPSM
jgi:hypothetical protein